MALKALFTRKWYLAKIPQGNLWAHSSLTWLALTAQHTKQRPSFIYHETELVLINRAKVRAAEIRSELKWRSIGSVMGIEIHWWWHAVVNRNSRSSKPFSSEGEVNRWMNNNIEDKIQHQKLLKVSGHKCLEPKTLLKFHDTKVLNHCSIFLVKTLKTTPKLAQWNFSIKHHVIHMSLSLSTPAASVDEWSAAQTTLIHRWWHQLLHWCNACMHPCTPGRKTKDFLE